ncbi:MAG: PspC domain-containing protein [Patescibacteria group bacterium]
MNKTVTIVLNGILFHIEERAYDSLKSYLDSIKAYYASNGDSEEILKDIESSIAEKFSAKVKTAKQVIALADVEELIRVMGTVEDFAEASGERVTDAAPSSGGKQEKGERSRRRLYRNPDDTIIAGVCSGIAAFFGIDPVIVRLLFGLSILLGGTGFFVYLVLWLIMPAAKTNTQKLEMQGKPVTLEKIEQVTREIKERSKQGAHAVKGFFPKLFAFFGAFFRALGTLITKLGPVLSIFLGSVFVFSMICAIAGLTFGIAVLLFSIDSAYINFGYPIKEAMGEAPYLLSVGAGFLTALIPLLFLFLFGIVLIRRKNVFTTITTSTLLVVWMIGIITLGVISIDAVPKIDRVIEEVNSKSDIVRTYDMAHFTSVEVDEPFTVIITKAEEYSVRATGQEYDIEELDVAVTDGTLEIDRDRREFYYCLFCWEKPVTITITMPELSEVSGTYGTRFSITDFEGYELNTKGRRDYWSILELRSSYISDTLHAINSIENSAERQKLRLELDRIEAIDNDTEFLTEMNLLWGTINLMITSGSSGTDEPAAQRTEAEPVQTDSAAPGSAAEPAAAQ